MAFHKSSFDELDVWYASCATMEVSCLSEDSRRLRVEAAPFLLYVGPFGCSGRKSAKAQELLRPVLRGCGRGLAPLPLWTWVEHGPGTQTWWKQRLRPPPFRPLSTGSVAAVEALLRSSDEAAGSSGRLRAHMGTQRITTPSCSVLCCWRGWWGWSGLGGGCHQPAKMPCP